jgi:glycosyltransferase involved in cell wall biosynthesis
VHLLQVCNVGDICGGTAACAWSITRALPGWRHTVACLSRPTAETITAFAPARIESWPRVDSRHVAALDPDIVLLHNTAANRCDPLDVPLSIQYLHSRLTPAQADVTVACSEWLRGHFSPALAPTVLYQPVDVEPDPVLAQPRSLRSRIIVGRLCTPTARKWPRELIPFYARLAAQHPLVDWEFVGCPGELVEPLRTACAGRAWFHPAERTARRHLRRWDALLYHHPTLTETFGRTVAEALRSGCIPIVDARGGFCEQVTAECGCLCDGLTDFHTALTELQDPLQRRRLSRAAQRIANERFAAQAFLAQFRAILLSSVCPARNVNGCNRTSALAGEGSGGGAG